MKLSTLTITKAAIVAAVYAALTMALYPISYGIVQFRLAEALTVLPAVMPAAVPGLFIGCLLANILGGYGWIDIVFGSLATLIAATLTWWIGRKRPALAPLPPVLVNTAIVGTYIWLLFDRTYPLSLSLTTFALGEGGVCYILGLPLLLLIHRNHTLMRLMGGDDLQ